MKMMRIIGIGVLEKNREGYTSLQAKDIPGLSTRDVSCPTGPGQGKATQGGSQGGESEGFSGQRMR